MSEGKIAVGKVSISDALRTIKGICDFYSVRYFIPYGESIAVYNCLNDDFHLFRWSAHINRYIYCGSEDYISNWMEQRIGI